METKSQRQKWMVNLHNIIREFLTRTERKAIEMLETNETTINRNLTITSTVLLKAHHTISTNLSSIVG